MDDTTKLLVQAGLTLATSILVAILTSLITVRLSLRRFYSERWWERKADAYSKIIEALYNMQRLNERELANYGTESGIPEEQLKELRSASREGWEEIRRASSIGAYVISDEAVNALRKYIAAVREIGREAQGWYDVTEQDLSALEKCIAQLREYAKKDLRIH